MIDIIWKFFEFMRLFFCCYVYFWTRKQSTLDFVDFRSVIKIFVYFTEIVCVKWSPAWRLRVIIMQDELSRAKRRLPKFPRIQAQGEQRYGSKFN